METDMEVKNVISELRSGFGSGLYSALIMIRTTFIKSKNSVTQLVQMGAVKLLIQLLEDQRRHKNQTKTTDILMSILANLCLEEDVRDQVVGCDGLSVIARVTLSAEQESIQNRGVRALANLALDVTNCDKIFEMEVPAFVAKRLMESEDAECRSTYCRALQLFGQTGKDAKRLMEETQAIQALAALLKLDNRKLALKSVRILSELSALRCCPSFTGQILAANILEELVTLADDEDNSSASCSLSIILRLCEQEIMRPALGSAGIVSLLVKLMRSDRSFVNKVLALNALCLCTKEAVNRNKIQEAGGLELFISALNINGTGPFSEGQFSVLYDRIISSLVNFLYNDECLGKLLDLGLVRILLEHLQRSCAFTLVADNLRTEIDSFAGSFEAVSAGRGRHSESSNTATGADMDCYADHSGSSVAVEETNAASGATTEFPNTSVQHELMGDDPGSDCLEFPSSTPTLHGQIDKVCQRVPDEQLNTDNEKREGIVDENSDDMVEDVEVELLNLPENLEMPLQQTSTSRHTFSINSPTYQMETAWKLEDYTSGVTCKSFSSDPAPYSISQHRSSSPYSVNTDLMQSPYSPLSAGASYYSPSQASASPSVLLSPVQSTFPSSPTSASHRGSPSWIYSSPEQENIPGSGARLFSPHSTASLSPRSVAYQNQFSPLTGTFSASPLHLFGERYSQSPTSSSQNSPCGQGHSFPDLETCLPSLNKSENTDQVLASSGTSLQDSVTGNIYSASEDDDDDDDDNVCYGVDGELNPSGIIADTFANENGGLHPTGTDVGCSTNENINSLAKPMSCSFKLISHKRGKNVNNATYSAGGSADVKHTMTPKRRRLNHKSITKDSLQGHSSAGHSTESTSEAMHNSSGPVLNVCLSDDEEVRNISQNPTVINSAATSSLKMEGVTDLLPVSAGTGGENEIQRPSSAYSTLGFENVRQKPFQRMASFPGKERRLAKASHFRKHLSGTVSSMSTTSRSSVLSVTNISDSPYRSPYSELVNTDVCSQATQTHSETNSAKAIFRSNSEDLFSSPVPGNSLKASEADESRREMSSCTKTDTTRRSDQSIDDVRVKKIHRITEANILILLARVSVKTNPIQLLVESTVVSCLLGYIASAPNPIRRSCRILYRLCSNPHCFEKLILMQVPALIVKTLVLENDGTFPHNLFCSDNRSIVDFLPSSQGSECSGSQTSEFGRKMDFEFADDAYSSMTSRKHSSLRSIFQNRHVLIVDCETSRINQGGDDIYEAGSSRVESCVRIGLELLYTLGAVAKSRFGEGEIQRLLMRPSAQNKLACLISTLHLQVGWCHITRDKFLNKHNLWEKVLPCLFIPEAPLVREAIVAAISLHVHLDNPDKLTQVVAKLPVCPDLKSTTRRRSVNESFLDQVNGKSKTKPSLRNADRTMMYADSVISTDLQKGSDELVADGLPVYQQTVSDSRYIKNVNHTGACSSDTTTFCPYQNLSQNYDVCFFITDENKYSHKVHAQRKTLVEKSEVFAAMFSGSYAESDQSEINLPDVSKHAFEFIIHYLHGCSSDCPVIASLSMEYVKNKIVTSELGARLDSPESSSAVKQHENMRDEEENVEESNSADKKESPCVVNTSSRSELIGERQLSVSSAERCVRTDTSQVLEFTQSQDSLDSLTLEDRPDHEEASHACRKLNFKNPLTGDGTEDAEILIGSRNSDPAEITLKCFEELISRCEHILALADRFLLHELICYPASVLAHVCLCAHTIEDIFHLACFYHLDRLAFDCIRETFMSCLPCSDAAAICVQLADDGYTEQIHTALKWLLNNMMTS